MLGRASRAKSGLSDYLKSGHRKDWHLSRDQKDEVKPIYGNLDLFAKTEKYLNEHKNYKDNYLHITLSFSQDDIDKLESMGEADAEQIKRDMVIDYIKHHTSGYDLDNEVIAYAEEHIPKVKLNEKGEKRFNHVHIGIALYNPLSDTKLRTTFANNTYIDEVLQTYINKKYDFTIPRTVAREQRKTSQNNRDRKYYIDALSGISNHNELVRYFDTHNINYKEVETKNNHYYKIIKSNGKDINLRGKGFEHIHDMTNDKEYIYPKDKQLDKLEEVLSGYYQARVEQIDDRRSVESKAKMEDIYSNTQNDKENAISMSYQQKLFYKHYKHLISDKLNGYYIDTKNDNNEVKFINKKKNIEVIDKGDKITATNTDNLSEKVKLMIDIAEAKEWNLATVSINGSEAFKREAKKQIAERIREREKIEPKKTLSLTKAVASKVVMDRPVTPIDYQHKQDAEAKEKAEQEAKPDIKLLKSTLRAEVVLEYAVKQYGIDAEEYEIIDNKINNKSNRQKPKNVIDFLQKEIRLSTGEAITQCQELFKKQPLSVDSQPIPTPPAEPIKLKPKQKRSREDARVYQSVNSENKKPAASTRSGMRKLSNIDLVSDKPKRPRVLLSSDERHRIRTKTASDLRMQPAGDRAYQTGSEATARGIKMPLILSISKDTSPAAASKWKQVEVANYTELATVMKQYPYSTANFENGQRSGDKVAGHGNLLIYDIDNDKYDKPLSLVQAKKLLEAHGISAMIMPSRSHNKPKKVASDHQRKHGKEVKEESHTAERFRIVIPTNKPLTNSTDLEIFREFQRLTAKALKLDEYADPKALNDKARFYYKSPIEVSPIVVKADRVMNIDKLEEVATQNIEKIRAEKEAERQRIEAIRADIAKHRAVERAESDTLTYAMPEAIVNIPITTLIETIEQGEAFKDGSYNMVRTQNAKYSVIEDNVAHDFKSDNTYNSLTYMQMQLGTTNLNIIAREAEKITGENYMAVNIEAVKRAIGNAMENATNNKSFEDAIKDTFSVKYAKLEKDTIKIADQQIRLSDAGYQKIDLIDKFRENREKIAEQKKQAEIESNLKEQERQKEQSLKGMQR
jgi:hypothetical protein